MQLTRTRVNRNLESALIFVGFLLVIGFVVWSDGLLAAVRQARFTPLIGDAVQTAETLFAIAYGVFFIRRLHQTWLRRVVLALAVLSMVYLAYEKMGRPLIGVDDANIFLVYARNLREGHGFVYNVGGERVEGVSSLLWVALISMAYFISANPEPIVLVANIGLLLATTFLAADFLAHLSEDSGEKVLMPAVYVALICASPEYITWMTLPLMETGLWSLLLVSATLILLRIGGPSDSRNARLFSLVLVLLLLTRPEGMLWVSLFIIAWFARVWIASGARSAARIVSGPLAVCVATIAGLTGFRLSYFKYPLPNTYYAKVSPSLKYNVSTSLYSYLLKFTESRFLVELAILTVTLILAVGVIRLIRTRFRLPPGRGTDAFLSRFMLSGICLAGLIIPLMYGGDHFASYRQYQPIYPLLLLAVLSVSLPLLRWLCVQVSSQTFAGILFIAVPVIAFSFTDSANWRNVDLYPVSIKLEFDVAAKGRQAGTSLKELFGEYSRLPSVGVITAGGVKYTYPGEVIDLLGLNNTRLAHSPGSREGLKNHAAFNNDLFFELSPEIALTTCSPDDPDYWFHYIQLDPRFQQQYACVTLQKRGGSTRVSVAMRKDLVVSLDERGQEVGIILSTSQE
jgi:hypothetical protein